MAEQRRRRKRGYRFEVMALEDAFLRWTPPRSVYSDQNKRPERYQQLKDAALAERYGVAAASGQDAAFVDQAFAGKPIDAENARALAKVLGRSLRERLVAEDAALEDCLRLSDPCINRFLLIESAEALFDARRRREFLASGLRLPDPLRAELACKLASPEYKTVQLSCTRVKAV